MEILIVLLGFFIKKSFGDCYSCTYISTLGNTDPFCDTVDSSTKLKPMGTECYVLIIKATAPGGIAYNVIQRGTFPENLVKNCATLETFRRNMLKIYSIGQLTCKTCTDSLCNGPTLLSLESTTEKPGDAATTVGTAKASRLHFKYPSQFGVLFWALISQWS